MCSTVSESHRGLVALAGKSMHGVAMKSHMKKFAVAAVVAVAAVATMAEGSSSGDGDTIVEPTETSADSGSDDGGGDSSGQGTRDNPAPLGSVARVGDWEVSVVKVNTDAAKIVADENSFNEPPASGFNYVLWEIDATYVGEESGNLWIDTSWKIVGSDGNSFSDSCGVIPDDITNAGETFSGASVSGNDCKAVEAAQLEGATILVEASFSLDDDRTFFALK